MANAKNQKTHYTLDDFRKFKLESSEDFGPKAFAEWAGIKPHQANLAYNGLISKARTSDVDLHNEMKEQWDARKKKGGVATSGQSRPKGKVATSTIMLSSTTAVASTTNVLIPMT
jgi:hypothetical protein